MEISAIEERFLTAFGMTTPGKNESPKNKGLGREHATSDSGITKSGSFASLWMTKACLAQKAAGLEDSPCATEEEDGDAEPGEFGGMSRSAGAYGGGVVFAGCEVLLDVVGEDGEVGQFVAEDGAWFGAGEAAIELAGLARVGRASSYLEIMVALSELRGDLLFLLIERERGNGGGEIFDGEEDVARLDDGDADGVELRVEKIGAMRRRNSSIACADQRRWDLARRFRR